MIGRILHLARREVLELSRQRVMVAVIATLLALIAALVVAAVGLLGLVQADPLAADAFAGWFAGLGLGLDGPDEVVAMTLGLGHFLLFTQYLGFASVLAGHTVLHDRQCHTLPFLLLAPVRRAEVLLGKVLGAISWPTALYLVVEAVTMGIVRALPAGAVHPAVLPPSPGWLVAVLVGAPVWAVAVGIVCATVSALARDVRTAQQGVWFVMFFATFLAGWLLAGQIAAGAGVQAGIAALGAGLGAAALAIGARVISRDLAR